MGGEGGAVFTVVQHRSGKHTKKKRTRARPRNELHLLDGNEITSAATSKKTGPETLSHAVLKQHIDPVAALCCQWCVKIWAVKWSGNVSWFSHSRKIAWKKQNKNNTKKQQQEQLGWIDFRQISHRASVDRVHSDAAADHFYYCVVIMNKIKGPDFPRRSALKKKKKHAVARHARTSQTLKWKRVVL